MRVHKYRAWERIYGKWIYFSLNNGDILYQSYWQDMKEHKEVKSLFLMPWQQYTGLKDKNGVEIYEGDIVELEDITGNKYRREVKLGWHGEVNGSYRFYYGFPLAWSDEDFGKDKLLNIEVIGNKYEHPHLLKEPKND